MSRTVKTIILILFVLLVLAVLYFLFIPQVSWTEIKKNISVESRKYAEPTKVEPIILSAVKEIIYDREQFRMVKTYSKQTGIPLEQVIVSTAVAMAVNYGYLEK
mgnify:CR=1 FL=1